MDRDGTARIVDRESQFEPLHGEGNQDARYQADKDGRGRYDESAGRAAGDESADPAVGGDRDVGSAEAETRNQSRGQSRCGSRQGGVDRYEQRAARLDAGK